MKTTILLICFLAQVHGLLLGNTIMNYPNASERETLLHYKNTVQRSTPSTSKQWSQFTLRAPYHSSIKDALLSYDPSLTITQGPASEHLYVFHHINQHSEIQKIITLLDKQQPIIRLHCYIYELALSKDRDINLLNTPLETGLLRANTAPFVIKQASRVLDTLKLLEKTGKARLISNPTLSIINHQRAQFSSGEKIPYVTTKISNNTLIEHLHQLDTGIKVSLIPHFVSSTNIRCKLDLTLGTVQQWKSFNESEYPVMASRTLTLDTKLILNEVTLIAQYTSKRSQSYQQSLPFIQRIPLIKHLFGNKTSSQAGQLLCIFIKPSM
ncbi:type II and III secretion system protein [bacterium]|nr:type II and III secretion system protein [bacterium]